MTDVQNGGLLLIDNEFRVAVEFQNDWFEAALARAAGRAGYSDWWPLEDFGAAVSLFLRQTLAERPLELPRLDRIVRTALRDLGYRSVATHFRSTNPFQRLSLFDCVGAAHPRRRFAFFRRLTTTLARLRDARVRHFEFHDLRPCVAALLEGEPAGWWSEVLLRLQIVSFVRDQMRTGSWPAEIHCSIS